MVRALHVHGSNDSSVKMVFSNWSINEAPQQALSEKLMNQTKTHMENARFMIVKTILIKGSSDFH